MTSKRSIITFRVYPESRRGLYFAVSIFPTAKEMRRYAGQVKPDTRSSYFRDAMAAVLPYSSNKRKTLGEIVFHRNCLGTEVITHEASHAAIRWVERKKLMIVDRSDDGYTPGEASESEEKFCLALGWIASQIVTACYDHGLYDKVLETHEPHK